MLFLGGLNHIIHNNSNIPMNFSLQHSTFSILIIILLSLTACQKQDSSTKTEITSFTVTKLDHDIIFTFSASAQNVQYYKIQYYALNSAYNSNNFITNETSTITKTITELALQSGELYNFSIQAVLNDGDLIYGTNVITLNIGDFCEAPHDLNFSNTFGLRWHTHDNSTTAAYYEISYGISGTTAIAGDKITLNTRSCKDMTLEEGTTYDFYVRSYCNSTLEWSNWAGPLSHYASQSLNLCVPPSNLSFSIIRNGNSYAIGATCTWDDTGNNNNTYEMNMVVDGYPPTTGNIETSTSTQMDYTPLLRNSEYDFYVRSICNNNTATSWVGPLNVNIGY